MTHDALLAARDQTVDRIRCAAAMLDGLVEIGWVDAEDAVEVAATVLSAVTNLLTYVDGAVEGVMATNQRINTLAGTAHDGG